MANVGDTLVGRYRLDARIGAGGFATVFSARDLRLDRDVAVKVLSPSHVSDPLVVARFDREARALAAFSHPNVVAIHDVEPAEPMVGAETFLVMDLCEGGSLATRLAETGSSRLAPDALVPILLDVAAGLDALHAAGMVHRDVKPSNVLLSGDRALIADLGIAAAAAGELTGSGDAIGTLAYLAPEQLAGAQATTATDVYAFGSVVFVGLTGRLPRTAGSVAELVAASSQVPPPVSSLVADLGNMFDWPVASALAHDPADRPTVQQLAWRLERGLERWQEIAAIMRTRLAPAPVGIAVSVGSAATAPSAGASAGQPSRMPSQPSPDDPTVIDPGLPTTKPLVGMAMPATQMAGKAGEELASSSARRGGADRPWLVAGGLAVALVVAAVLALALLNGGGDARPGGIAVEPSVVPATTGPRASATAAAPYPSAPSPSTTFGTPTRTGPYAVALEASREMQAAIEAARGRAGLNGHEAKDLEGSLDRFDRALDDRDAEAARSIAEAMADAVEELVDGNEVSAEAGQRLQSAVVDVVDAADALPE
jgi:serine/threonine protein kinase